MRQKTRSLVAIKSVQLQKLNKKLKENLYSEIHILKDLHHPHIVSLIDCQETSAHIHLVMEFCQLGDLSYFIKKRDRLSSHPATADMMRKYPAQPNGGLHEVIVRHFLKQLASALEFLRARNFIHRDVKPQNLLLNPSPLHLALAPSELPYAVSEDSLVPVAGVESLPMLKLADFGFARSLPSTSLAETLCGSPLYMAPEILRYEKYDAKADLWSVGTVLFEMVAGRPPFRATNHVELLRRIERGEDRIAFPDGLAATDEMRSLIRALLKRNPVERIGFDDFFGHSVVGDDIPGLVGEDRPRPPPSPEPIRDEREAEGQGQDGEEQDTAPGRRRRRRRRLRRASSATATAASAMDVERRRSTERNRPQPPFPAALGPRPETTVSAKLATAAAAAAAAAAAVDPQSHKRPPSSGDSSRTPSHHRRPDASARATASGDREHGPASRRPPMITHATAPARPDTHQGRRPTAVTVEMERQVSRNSSSPGSSLLVQRQREQHPPAAARDEKESSLQDLRARAEQDVAFERDYVLVEKRAVEVNAFADELAASPRIHGGGVQVRPSRPQGGVIARRATTHGSLPTSGGGPSQAATSRAIQVATTTTTTTAKHGPDPPHRRRSSHDRRYGASPTSATSAISKALNMANFRLFGVGFSPPFVGKGAYSPPQAYGAFPAYPTTQGSFSVVGDGRANLPQDEDARVVQVVEEAATRSDVVYGFAEVKLKQLMPLAPSMDHGLGLRSAGIAEEGAGGEQDGDESLTVDAVLTLSEEALVLYVKVLVLLAKVMDIAGVWWARRDRGEAMPSSPSSPSSRGDLGATGAVTASRINNVVQWVRSRFNHTLEKAEFVTLKLLEAQRRLPMSHPSQPSNHGTGSSSSTTTTRMGTSADTVVVASGVTAEKLMYERALELSRAAAVNELIGEDLAGCEMAYATAVRMLEAVLESDEDVAARASDGGEDSRQDVNGMQWEDRQIVEKRGCLPQGGGGGGGGGGFFVIFWPAKLIVEQSSPVCGSDWAR